MLLVALCLANLVVVVYHVRCVLQDEKAFTPRPPQGPISAWKVAGLCELPVAPDQTEVAFIALTGHCYRRVDTARHEGLDHTEGLPRHCTCGFYALKSLGRTMGQVFFPGRWLLEVELYGTVWEGTGGYRAEKQRVINLYGQCSCGQPATRIARIQDYKNPFVMTDGHLLVGVCPTHAVANSYSLADFSRMLGVAIHPLTEEFLHDVYRSDPEEARDSGSG